MQCLRTSLAIALLSGSVLVQSPAHATQLCTYEVHSPNVMSQGIVHRLATAGVAAIVNSRTSTETFREYTVFQAPQVRVGRIVFEKSLLSRTSYVRFEDATGFLIAQARESIYPCPVRNPRGRCYDTAIYSIFDGTDLDGAPPFLVRDGLYGLEWYRYGNPMNVTLWRSELRATIDWIVDYYHSTSVAEVDEAFSALDEIHYGFYSNPLLHPLADLLRVYETRHGFAVAGIVPSNAHYNAVLDVFFDAGIYNVRPDLIIDTGYVPPLQPYLPMIERCL